MKDRKIIILHFSDRDEYGDNMTKTIKDAFDYFDRDNRTHLNVEVRKVALTQQQVDDWHLPDTQLEAIEPNQFKQLIHDSVDDLIDKPKLAETWAQIREGRKKIQELLDGIIWDQ